MLIVAGDGGMVNLVISRFRYPLMDAAHFVCPIQRLRVLLHRNYQFLRVIHIHIHCIKLGTEVLHNRPKRFQLISVVQNLRKNLLKECHNVGECCFY